MLGLLPPCPGDARRIKRPAKVIARSASDRTDEWPYWFVADADHPGINITSRIASALGYDWRLGAVLADRETAEKIAREWNGEGTGKS